MNPELMTIILTVLGCKAIWWAFAALCGWFEGHYFDLVYRHGSNHPNLHSWFTLLRSVVALGLTWHTLEYLDWVDAGVFGLICACTFSFIHNGVLYCTRNKYAPEKYVKRWWANKEPGEDHKASKWELSVFWRTGFFAAGIIGLITIFRDAHYYAV